MARHHDAGWCRGSLTRESIDAAGGITFASRDSVADWPGVAAM